jgi:cutinase
MHNAVSGLSAAVKKKIVAGVLFGDTRNAQDKGQVPNYPKDQVMIFCYQDDGVCGGKLQVTQAHMAYRQKQEGPKAVAFLKGKIDPVLPAGSAASPAAAVAAPPADASVAEKRVVVTKRY